MGLGRYGKTLVGEGGGVRQYLETGGKGEVGEGGFLKPNVIRKTGKFEGGSIEDNFARRRLPKFVGRVVKDGSRKLRGVKRPLGGSVGEIGVRVCNYLGGKTGERNDGDRRSKKTSVVRGTKSRSRGGGVGGQGLRVDRQRNVR